MDGDANGCSRDCRRILKNFIGILFVIFVWLMFIGTVTSKNSDELVTSISRHSLKHVVPVPKAKQYAPTNADPVYASKRRVPSGPDPIHNRHTIYYLKDYVRAVPSVKLAGILGHTLTQGGYRLTLVSLA